MTPPLTPKIFSSTLNDGLQLFWNGSGCRRMAMPSRASIGVVSAAGPVDELLARSPSPCEASERVGKKDWLTVLYGAVFGMIVNDIDPPHAVQGLLRR
jgi:hypothetical protein